MRGIGHATGAITFVNALGTGVGSAAGIALPVEATLELEPVRAEPSTAIGSEGDSPLVRAMLARALESWAPQRTWRSALQIRSEIPAARGLKSSSAVTGAVGRAVASALHLLVTNDEIARLSADVSQGIGLSATGAFDDALATLEPGIHVTENPTRRRVRTDTIDPSWQVILWIPRQPHLPSPVYREQFRRLAGDAALAEKAARAGDPLRAMALNTEVVEHAVGYDYAGLRESLRRHGALGSGVSGLGPSLAVVLPPERIAPVLRALPPGEGDVLVTRFATGLTERLSEAA
jgi:shikimate kinase